MTLGTIYIIVNDISRSMDFYKILLQEKPIYQNDDRWVQFNNNIALYNKDYDKKLMNKDSNERFNRTYIDEFYKDEGLRKNNIMVLNFEVEDLKSEYDRLKKANIGELSELMYVNVHMSYWYFNIIDPDGNTIEITGRYTAAPY